MAVNVAQSGRDDAARHFMLDIDGTLGHSQWQRPRDCGEP
jgi:hypothetical protein